MNRTTIYSSTRVTTVVGVDEWHITAVATPDKRVADFPRIEAEGESKPAFLPYNQFLIFLFLRRIQEHFKEDFVCGLNQSAEGLNDKMRH